MVDLLLRAPKLELRFEVDLTVVETVQPVLRLLPDSVR